MTRIENIIIFTSLLTISWSQSTILFEGDECVLNDGTNARGICLKQSSCPSTRANARRGEYPQICSFNIREPVVCCKMEERNKRRPSQTNRNQRIAEQKCQEYSKLFAKTVEVISLSLHPSVNQITVSECEKSVPLIVGGVKATTNEFPHMATIGWTQWDGIIEWNCGGSIVSERWILTAAHCQFRMRVEPDIVRVGTKRLSRPDYGYEDFQIDKFVRPQEPQRYVVSSRYNDIMLIRVDRTISFNKNLRPACLWHQNRIDSSTALASGWGAIGQYKQGSDDLLKVSLDIFDNSMCYKQYPIDRKSKYGVIDSQLCAGELAGGKDSCQGDSGGPLQITQDNNQCVYYLVGVTSYGNGCGNENTPGIYTRISSYIDWIESVVWR